MGGKFIVVEGLEGAGKSNAQRVVVRTLREHGIECITTREPGGTPIAEALRDLWKQGIGTEHTTDKAEVLMIFAARTQLVETVIKPTLASGKWVVGDRHNMSSQAYQGAGRNLQELVDQIGSVILDGFEPDFTIYLDLDPAVGLARAKGRGALDRIEQQHIDFFHRTRKRYLELTTKNSKAVIIDAERSIKRVSVDIQQAVENFLKIAK
ncbi:dTMP kinase [Vespertiliibacter pulmonis]|uniref:Thymidylate kinase n=1 Tax=Vespertiliibacter pulmonis TaxID=1443036 RepID=A0A3N4VHN9_9PAST|nr:dTMP kinase [Vespertiliibacter pulmonis]QLB20682.1 dTMP kinase [Vespertiliibacter pulmonis]RPE82566.1 thymidylate kinase [Vespertiliibacter pulmonis]